MDSRAAAWAEYYKKLAEYQEAQQEAQRHATGTQAAAPDSTSASHHLQVYQQQLQEYQAQVEQNQQAAQAAQQQLQALAQAEAQLEEHRQQQIAAQEASRESQLQAQQQSKVRIAEKRGRDEDAAPGLARQRVGSPMLEVRLHLDRSAAVSHWLNPKSPGPGLVSEFLERHAARMEDPDTQLVERYSTAIQRCSEEGKIVLDHLSGSGTDCQPNVAAERLASVWALMCSWGPHQPAGADLRAAHAALMPGGGLERLNGVHVANTRFVDPPEKLPGLLDDLAAALQHVLARTDVTPEGKAGWAVYSFLALHPFLDGNGRLGRCFANFVLRRCGFPLYVCLADNEGVRKRYREAIVAGHTANGDTRPLAKHVQDCVTRLWKRADDEWAEQVRTARARAFREQATSETCIICWEARPEVAALCCGATLHINCMVKSLQRRESCPKCRAVMSALELPPPAAADNTEDNTEDDTEAEMLQNPGAPLGNGARPHFPPSDDDTAEDDTVEDDTVEDDTVGDDTLPNAPHQAAVGNGRSLRWTDDVILEIAPGFSWHAPMSRWVQRAFDQCTSDAERVAVDRSCREAINRWMRNGVLFLHDWNEEPLPLPCAGTPAQHAIVRQFALKLFAQRPSGIAKPRSILLEDADGVAHGNGEKHFFEHAEYEMAKAHHRMLMAAGSPCVMQNVTWDDESMRMRWSPLGEPVAVHNVRGHAVEVRSFGVNILVVPHGVFGLCQLRVGDRASDHWENANAVYAVVLHCLIAQVLQVADLNGRNFIATVDPMSMPVAIDAAEQSADFNYDARLVSSAIFTSNNNGAPTPWMADRIDDVVWRRGHAMLEELCRVDFEGILRDEGRQHPSLHLERRCQEMTRRRGKILDLLNVNRHFLVDPVLGVLGA